MKTHYDVLGVPPNADQETVKAAYRKIVKAHHPDLNEGDDAAELRSKQIIAAYALLKDPERRARYDEKLRRRRSRVRMRVRMFVITVLVSAGLASGSTLFFLNFLLKPNTGAPVARISATATEKVALAEDAAHATAKSPALPPREITDAAPVENSAPSPASIATDPSPPAPDQTHPSHETAWLDIDKNGKVEDIWVFIREHAGTPQAALAEKRLEPLINAIDDIASLKALAAKATGGIAERVLGRLGQLAAAKEDITASLPEQTANATQSDAAPAKAVTDEAHPPEAERAAVAHDDSGARLASSDPQSTVHHALSLMSSGQYVMATPISRDSAPITHGNAKYYVYRAGFWASRGDLDHALTDYDAAILLDGANIAAFHGRGLLRWRRGEIELALADFDQAIRLSFADPKIYLDRGMIWYERGRYDRAIADFNQAIKLAPHLANAYSYRGTALRRKGEFKSAIADLDQAIRLNPDMTDAHRNRDLARTERDDPVEAMSETSR